MVLIFLVTKVFQKGKMFHSLTSDSMSLNGRRQGLMVTEISLCLELKSRKGRGRPGHEIMVAALPKPSPHKKSFRCSPVRNAFRRFLFFSNIRYCLFKIYLKMLPGTRGCNISCKDVLNRQCNYLPVNTTGNFS